MRIRASIQPSFLGAILAGIALWLSPPASALTFVTSHLSRDYLLRPWDDESRLPAPSTRALAQTSDGFIWVGTSSGLYRLNGTGPSTRYSLPEVAGTTTDSILTLLADSRGRLWVGTDQSLMIYDRGDWRTVPREGTSQLSPIISLVEAAPDLVYFSTPEGIARSNGTVIQSEELPAGIPRGRRPWTLAVDNSGVVWAVNEGTLLQKSNGTWSPALSEVGQPVQYAGLAPARRGGVWVSEERRLTRRVSHQLVEEFAYPDDFGDESLLVYEDRLNQLWVGGATAGLLILETNGIGHRVTTRQGLPNNSVSSLLEDGEGGLFVGTGRGGVLQLIRRRVQILHAESLEANAAHITAVTRNPEGRILFGSGLGEVFLQTDTQSQLLCRLEDNQTLRSLLCTRRGQLWLGTESHGLWRWDGDRLVPGPTLPSKNAAVLLLHEDGSGAIWIGSEEGCYRLEPEQALPVEIPELRRQTLVGMVQTPQGIVYLASPTQLYRLQNDRPRPVDLPPGRTDLRMVSLTTDATGGLWISLKNGGLLWRRPDGTSFHFDSTHGLPEHSLGALILGDANQLWGSSSIGLFGFGLEELKRVAEGALPQINPFLLNRQDGLMRTSARASGEPGSTRTPDGRLWFATPRGVASLMPSLLKRQTNMVRVAVEAIEVDGVRHTPPPGDLVLPPGTHRVRLHYTAPIYSAPDRVLFEYRIEEPGSTWLPVGDSRSFELLPMEPGSYRVRIRASNCDRVWNGPPTSISFTIHAFFWQTWQFRLLVVLGVMAALGAWIWRYQQQRLQRGNEALRQEKRVAEERAHRERQLRQSHKMEALGTLAGGIAHDFNNILTAISGNTQLAISDLPPDHPVQVSLGEVKRGTRRASDLVRQILTFSRQEKQTLECMALEPIITEALQLLRINIAPGIQIETQFTPDSPMILADPSQIHQIVLNLGTNAAQAIGRRSGLIVFEQTVVETYSDKPLLPVGGDTQPGRYVRLRVRDNGSGMDRETMDRVFDPFFTTKGPNQGTGLGLSVVHGIMQRLGGSIQVESQIGVGTTFTLFFPVALRQPTPAPPQPVELRQGHGEQVLVVDDEESIVFLTTRILKKLGYRSRGFRSPEEALLQFEARPHDYAAIITDLSMPELSGPELARKMFAIRPDIPIILTTGYIRPEDQELAERAGIRHILLKPNTVSEMGQALSEVLQTRTAHVGPRNRNVELRTET